MERELGKNRHVIPRIQIDDQILRGVLLCVFWQCWLNPVKARGPVAFGAGTQPNNRLPHHFF